MESMAGDVSVRHAKSGAVDKGRMRTAVTGGWYVWEEEERADARVEETTLTDVYDNNGVGNEAGVGQRNEQHVHGDKAERRERAVERGGRGQIRPRYLRPRSGPTQTSTTPTPQPHATNGNGEDTRRRLRGFHPREGIG